MASQRSRPRAPVDREDDDQRLAAMRERGAHLSLPLRLLALLGALAFVMLGLASALVPLRFQPTPPASPRSSSPAV